MDSSESLPSSSFLPFLSSTLHSLQCPDSILSQNESESVSHSVVLDSLRVHGLSPPGSSVHGILQAGILEWVAFPSPEDLPNPGIDPGSPALQADSLPSEPPGKPQSQSPSSRSNSPSFRIWLSLGGLNGQPLYSSVKSTSISLAGIDLFS